MEVNLTDIELNDNIASGALVSTSLLHYFSQLAQANDSRCNFDAMFNKMSNEQYEMLNTNAFMN